MHFEFTKYGKFAALVYTYNYFFIKNIALYKKGMDIIETDRQIYKTNHNFRLEQISLALHASSTLTIIILLTKL